eukprot:CAMPEP_0170617980 /NCGR_PEP_ID=MMETSP0224-20130122/26713_1 /TAXON_ID=285029 /ORGANISM="Togula jolla, Strain CCCM 725" /LENGTH=302 /DNA_ID=CAMNT_0010943921 /DNA_START=83 /DNA_END=991 /DNA_ORIENTATION=+
MIRVLSLLALLTVAATEELLEAEPSSIWDGLDTEDDTYLSAMVEANVIDLNSANRKQIQVMGLQDTGTNLLTAMLRSNFQNQITLWDSTHVDETRGLWKHANAGAIVEQVPDIVAPLAERQVSVIAMIRDPLSWLQSIHKAPYEFSSCVSGDDWLQRSCTHRVPCGYRNNGTSETYSNLVSVWAHWTRSYGRLKKVGVKHVLAIRYEDLVLYPEQVMNEIATSLKLKPPPTISLVTAPAKSHGEAVGREAAMAKINEQSFLADFKTDSLSMVCKQLKPFRKVLDFHSYQGCKEAKSFLKQHG